MTSKRPIWAGLLIAVFAALCLGPPALAQDNSRYEGRLSPRPIDGRMRGQLTGSGKISAVLEGNQLQIVGEFAGMQTPAVAAGLRRGVASGVAGPVFANLEVVRASSGLVYGSATLDRSQLESLDQGALYVQIDGAEAEDGTLWGFLIKQ